MPPPPVSSKTPPDDVAMYRAIVGYRATVDEPPPPLPAGFRKFLLRQIETAHGLARRRFREAVSRIVSQATRRPPRGAKAESEPHLRPPAET
jgi:hypothetical protein